MSIGADLSADYWRALHASLVLQVLFLLFAALCLDGGQLMQWCAVALAAAS